MPIMQFHVGSDRSNHRKEIEHTNKYKNTGKIIFTSNFILILLRLYSRPTCTNGYCVAGGDRQDTEPKGVA